MTRTGNLNETSLTADAAEALRKLIIHGDLVSGQRIVERTVCRQLNVSRTPLREALKLLEQDGLVEMSRHRGARVAAYSASDALNLFAVIARLESLAAELVASHVEEAELDLLERLHAEMSDHFAAKRLDDYFAVNSAIHDMILSLSRNPVLQSCHGRLMMQARRGRYMAIVDTARWQQAMGEHDLLMAALRCRDATIAGHVWRNHLLNTGKTVAQALSNGAEPDRVEAAEPMEV